MGDVVGRYEGDIVGKDEGDTVGGGDVGDIVGRIEGDTVGRGDEGDIVERMSSRSPFPLPPSGLSVGRIVAVSAFAKQQKIAPRKVIKKRGTLLGIER